MQLISVFFKLNCYLAWKWTLKMLQKCFGVWLLSKNLRNQFSTHKSMRLAWENSWHLVTPPLVSSPNDVWEMSAEIPYWWHITTQIWVVLLIGRIKFPMRHDQSEALPRSGQWHIISMEFLCLFLRRPLVGKPVVAAPNVGCFLRLAWDRSWIKRNRETHNKVVRLGKSEFRTYTQKLTHPLHHLCK